MGEQVPQESAMPQAFFAQPRSHSRRSHKDLANFAEVEISDVQLKQRCSAETKSNFY
jgi:hypothetical protein